MVSDNYAQVKAWRAANPEKWREQKRRYRERHPEKGNRWSQFNESQREALAPRATLKVSTQTREQRGLPTW